MAEFMIGVNYWDSASGTDMWKNWNEDVVEKDLAALEKCGVKYLRVFPNWRDFQPVAKLYSCKNGCGEYVNAEDESDLYHNISGVNWEMIDHFRRFAQIADQHGMKLNVGVLTGWMSGRQFKPAAIDSKNPIADPEAMMWIHRFVDTFVSAVQDLPNIVLWDLGNECNNLGTAENTYQAYTWTAFVRNCIRQADPKKRPIASGMHGLGVGDPNPWTIAHQGELCDMMTTHPYPSPSVCADIEPYNGLRTTIMPTAQSIYYSGLGGKPCMIQEQGVFSEMRGNREMAAQFVRVNILSAWSNDLTGYYYWCGTEHTNLDKAPYTWSIMERQLGIMDINREPKPQGREMAKMQKLLAGMPDLPPKQVDAVVVLPHEGNPFVKATSAFVLAQEAGFNVSVRKTDTALPECGAYIVPCIEGWSVMRKQTLDFLLDRAKNHGAKVLFTYDGGDFICIDEIFGLRSNGLYQQNQTHTAHFPFGDLKYTAKWNVQMESVGAEVVARNEEGNIVMSRNAYGKGEIWFLGFPLETLASNMVDGFRPDRNEPFYQVYRLFAKDACDSYVMQTENPFIGITQHMEGESGYITAINYSDAPQNPEFAITDGWTYEVLYGSTDQIPACDAAILKVKKS